MPDTGQLTALAAIELVVANRQQELADLLQSFASSDNEQDRGAFVAGLLLHASSLLINVSQAAGKDPLDVVHAIRFELLDSAA